MNARPIVPVLVALLGTIAMGCSSNVGDALGSGAAVGGGNGDGEASGGDAGNGAGGNGANGGSTSTGTGAGGTGVAGDGGAGGASNIDSGTVATGSSGGASPALVFSPYKDTGINMNWNTNVISTSVSGSPAPFGSDITKSGATAVTLAFATGECGTENWGGVAGDAMATTNEPLLTQAGVKYIVSVGGAAGSFTCGTDSGMATFLGRWASANLIGVDFDIEAGQSQDVINALVARIQTAHGTRPGLRFSLTLGVLAASQQGAATAQSLGANAVDVFNVYGDDTLEAIKTTLGFNGEASTWPSYVTVNLMTMDYGSASAGNCVVTGSTCQMGQSAIQAAYDIHDKWGVPYTNIELTPMLGGNDVSGEQFTLDDADTVAKFAIAQNLAGVHYWSYDRDLDCAAGSASATCNSMGTGYAGAYGYLKRFLADGLH